MHVLPDLLNIRQACYLFMFLRLKIGCYQSLKILVTQEAECPFTGNFLNAVYEQYFVLSLLGLFMRRMTTHDSIGEL